MIYHWEVVFAALGDGDKKGDNMRNELKDGYDPYHWNVFVVALEDGKKEGGNSEMDMIHII